MVLAVCFILVVGDAKRLVDGMALGVAATAGAAGGCAGLIRWLVPVLGSIVIGAIAADPGAIAGPRVIPIAVAEGRAGAIAGGGASDCAKSEMRSCTMFGAPAGPLWGTDRVR